jgi:type IV secretion system protein VirB9
MSRPRTPFPFAAGPLGGAGALLCWFACAWAGAAAAQAPLMRPAFDAPPAGRSLPVPGALDPRVRTVLYQEDAVIAIRGHYGYQIMLEFGEDERIENVSIGDSLAWQVTPNRRADTLFMKPIELDAATNMSVVTSKRRYVFELTAREPSGPNDPNILYRVRMVFPEPAAADAVAAPSGPVAPQAVNTAYSVSGSPRNIPARVFDDGVRTYFAWPANASAPAVFALLPDGSESVVNFAMVGDLMAVERLAPAFVLRNGSEQTIVHNDGWSDPAPGPLAPAVREPPRRQGVASWFRPKTKGGAHDRR